MYKRLFCNLQIIASRCGEQQFFFSFFTLFCHILLQGERTDHMMGGNLSSTVCTDECEAFLMYLFGAGDSTCNMDIYKIKLLSTNVILQFSYHPVNFCLMWFQTDGN